MNRRPERSVFMEQITAVKSLSWLLLAVVIAPCPVIAADSPAAGPRPATPGAAVAVPADQPAIPFPAALQAAAISVGQLDSILEDGLLLGNGDLNTLVSTEGGQLVFMLTKNDVWDARLDSKRDPPLPTLALIKRLAAESAPHGDPQILADGWGQRQADSYHAHPYPCPRLCGRLVLGRTPARPVWRRIRAEGVHNAFEYRDAAAVMSIAGRPKASNGYSLEPLAVPTDAYNQLRIKLSGTENAQYYIDLMDSAGKPLLASGWKETPTEPAEKTFPLRPGETIGRVILYTWTEDGRRAENRFAEVVLEGPRGKLPLDLTNLAAPSSPAQLDILRAVARTTGSPESVPAAEMRVLADRNVLLIKADGRAHLAPAASADTPPAASGDDGGTLWLTQEIPGDEDWPGMRFAVAAASRGEWRAVAIVTSREADDPRAAALDLARTTAAAVPEEMIRGHEAEWARFWSASGIKLADPVLESMWYRNLYFLRCVSKPGAIAPGLFAGLIDASPAWHGDYHTNYNIQQTFWGAYAANHCELAEPYDRLIREYLPRAQWLSRQVFALPGAYFPHVLFAYEPADPATCHSPVGRQYLHHVWGFTIGVSGFTVQPLWWHYKYDPRREFLEQVAYPAVREVARFYAEFIEQCPEQQGGRQSSRHTPCAGRAHGVCGLQECGDPTVVLAPSVSPEHWGWTKGFERNRNCTFDIAMARYTLEAAIEGAGVLGRDAELIARWRQALRKLPPYPVTKSDPPIVVDVQDAPPIVYNIAVPAVPVFPGDVVTCWSPAAEQELLGRTIDGLKWNGNNSAMILSVARARLSMPGTADWVRQELVARLRPNGTLTLNRREPPQAFNNFGHYTEQFAATMAVSELLVQSVGDVVRIFPAWPKDQDARFTNLRTQGGFLVSAEQRGGAVVRLEVTATIGGKLRLLSPWATTMVNGHRLQPDARGVVEIDTTAGMHGALTEK